MELIYYWINDYRCIHEQGFCLSPEYNISMLKKENGRILANPGSITRPRGCDLRCYLLLDEEKISLKTLDGKLVKEIKFDSVDNAL